MLRSLGRVLESALHIHALGDILRGLTGLSVGKDTDGEERKSMEKEGGFFSMDDEIRIGAILRSKAQDGSNEFPDAEAFWEFVNFLFPRKLSLTDFAGRQGVYQYILRQPSAERTAKVVKTTRSSASANSAGPQTGAQVTERRTYEDRQKIHDGVKEELHRWIDIITSAPTREQGFVALQEKLARENAPFMKYHNPLGDIDVAEGERAVRRASGGFRAAARKFFAAALTVAGTFTFGWWFLAAVLAAYLLLERRRRI